MKGNNALYVSTVGKNKRNRQSFHNHTEVQNNDNFDIDSWFCPEINTS